MSIAPARWASIPARIALDADTFVGEPRIAGARIGVGLILRQLADGLPAKTLLEACPTITEPEIAAALVFAADQMCPMQVEDAAATAD